ncbi:MAG: hypothetical protein ACLS24_09395 [Dialister invisus]|uniref:hypothetical protein n=1 Tax=Dialister invisus TaxID=218538 RepID=UPI003993A5BC
MEPITREEYYLAKIAGTYKGKTPKPVTIEEYYLATMAGDYSGNTPQPVTRLQYYMAKVAGVWGGSIPAPVTRLEYYWSAIANGEGKVFPPVTREEHFLVLVADAYSVVLTVVTGNPALLEGVKGNRFTSLTLHGKSTQVSTTGAQLLDASLLKNTSSVSVECNGSDIIITALEDGPYRQTSSVPIGFFEEGDQICIAAEAFPKDNVVIIRDSSGATIANVIISNGVQEVVTIPANGTYRIILCINKGVSVKAGTVGVFSKFIVNKGNVSKDYEPYTGGKPSPSPEYPQEIKSVGQDGEIGIEVLGKNLIPFPYPMLGGAGTQIEHKGVKYTVQSDGGIRCVGTPTAIEYINLSRIKFSNVGLHAMHPTDGKIVLSGEKMTYDPSNNALFIYITSDLLGKPIDTVIYPQIEFGTVATEYEPYKPAQKLIIPTPNGLPGIPVSSGGNYTDEKGQQWVADEIDLARDERVKWIGEYELTGKENVADFGLRPRARIASIIIPDAYIDAGNHVILKAVMSNKYKQVSFNKVGNNINLIARGQQRNICISIPTDIGIEDFKTDLSNQYASGHPAKVFYKLDTPIRTPIPPETIAAYKALRTYSPTTTVANDAGAGMSVGYKKAK